MEAMREITPAFWDRKSSEEFARALSSFRRAEAEWRIWLFADDPAKDTRPRA
jgi:hypothetical protein